MREELNGSFSFSNPQPVAYLATGKVTAADRQNSEASAGLWQELRAWGHQPCLSCSQLSLSHPCFEVRLLGKSVASSAARDAETCCPDLLNGAFPAWASVNTSWGSPNSVSARPEHQQAEGAAEVGSLIHLHLSPPQENRQPRLGLSCPFRLSLRSF